MSEKIVSVTINDDGTFTVEGSGFKGTGCEKVIKQFEAMGKVTSETKKPEYYQNPGANNTVSTGR